MKRRAFIAALGAGTAWTLTARAQHSDRMPRIGVLMSNVENDPEGRARADALRSGLRELGRSDGQNLHIDWRWSGGDVELSRAQASELVALAPDVIVANSTANLAALKQATQSIPIVFAVVNDPVGQGFVSSLMHPGGNITGFTFVEYSMFGKSLELLKQLATGITHVAFMFNPDTVPYYELFLPSFEAVARSDAILVMGHRVRSAADIDGAIADLAMPGGGLILPPDAYTLVHRAIIVNSARRHGVPAIYSYRQIVREGGLLSYGPETADIFRRSASYVDRILRGASPADLPCQTPTKFELAVNLPTAAALGLSVPPTLTALADEVIE